MNKWKCMKLIIILVLGMYLIVTVDKLCLIIIKIICITFISCTQYCPE
jgi:hypothetical protein